MLYVTTRVGHDAFTAFRALSEDRGPEGGFFVPMQFPNFHEEQIKALADKSFSQNVADILNLFLGTKLDGKGLELSIGRYPVKLTGLNGRTIVAQTWHNPVYRFERLACGIEKAVRQSGQNNQTASDWLLLATRIGVLFGVFGLLQNDGLVSKNRKVDVALPSGDLSLLMAVWHARAMGLPVATIVCCCNENTGLWNLLHKGELRTDALAVRTHTPECDYTIPTDLERLIFATLGREETKRYYEVCRIGGTYYLEPEQLELLRKGIHVSMVSDKRMASTIPNLYKTTGFIADPYTALAYSGLTDYRAVTGISRHALIVSEESPVFSLRFIAQCMNITPAELRNRLE